MQIITYDDVIAIQALQAQIKRSEAARSNDAIRIRLEEEVVSLQKERDIAIEAFDVLTMACANTGNPNPSGPWVTRSLALARVKDREKMKDLETKNENYLHHITVLEDEIRVLRIREIELERSRVAEYIATKDSASPHVPHEGWYPLYKESGPSK